MIDVSHKVPTLRKAVAEGFITLTPEALQIVRDPSLNPKGSVLTVARVAAILAVKNTPTSIPLCHSVVINSVGVDMVEEREGVRVMVSVVCEGKTGVEMEALAGVAAGLLTIYDMTKAISHCHTITDIKLVQKTGGKSSFVS